MWNMEGLLGMGQGSVAGNLLGSWGGLGQDIGASFSGLGESFPSMDSMGDSLFGSGTNFKDMTQPQMDAFGNQLSSMGNSGDFAGQQNYFDSITNGDVGFGGKVGVSPDGLSGSLWDGATSKNGKNWMDTGISAFGGYNDYKNSKTMKDYMKQQNNRANMNQAWANTYAQRDIDKQDRQRNLKF